MMSGTAMQVESLVKNLARGGKVIIGYRRVSGLLRMGKLKAAVLARGSPGPIFSDTVRYAKLGGIPLIVYPGSSMDLGSALGKPFPVTVIGVLDLGNVPVDVINTLASQTAQEGGERGVVGDKAQP